MKREADFGQRDVYYTGIQGRHEDAHTHNPHDRPFARRLPAGPGGYLWPFIPCIGSGSYHGVPVSRLVAVL